jgi:hypothetical protein
MQHVEDPTRTGGRALAGRQIEQASSELEWTTTSTTRHPPGCSLQPAIAMPHFLFKYRLYFQIIILIFLLIIS